MKRFEVRSIEIEAGYAQTFQYISDPNNLPEWTNAFHSVSNGAAVMRTESGTVEVELTVRAPREQGTIDWVMKFPDGSEAIAYSRLIPLGDERNAYIFILTPPPVPLDRLEGALEQQSEILKKELERLRRILNGKTAETAR